MKKVKVAIIGHGHLGKWHAQKADQLEKSELVAIVEPNAESAKKIKETYSQIKVVANIGDIIDEIDAAIVVTPTSVHFECVKQLLENKKHVFCEKPLCSTVEQTKSLEPLIKDRVLQVGHSERCHQVWDIARDQLKSMQSPRTIKIDRYAPFKGRATDVDVVQDLMIHDIDLVKYLTGASFVNVKAKGHKIRTKHWDHVTALFETELGDTVIITSGRNHTEEKRSLEIMSEQGCLYVDLFSNQYSFATDDQFEDGEFVKTNGYEKRDHLLVEQEYFYNSILEGADVFVNYEDGAYAVKVVNDVLNSLETQSEVKI